MTTITKSEFDTDGNYLGLITVIREDSFKDRSSGHWRTPTTEATRWVENWEEFIKAGGQTCWEEDSTELTLRLPSPYKFSIRFKP